MVAVGRSISGFNNALLLLGRLRFLTWCPLMLWSLVAYDADASLRIRLRGVTCIQCTSGL
jgi:hypothetical protein